MNAKFIVAIVLLAAAVALFASMGGGGGDPVMHLALPDYVAKYQPGHEAVVDVAGTVSQVETGYPIRFTLRDAKTGAALSVRTQADISTDAFGPGKDVRVIGRLGDDGVFEADEVLVQCSHSYEEAKTGAAPQP